MLKHRAVTSLSWASYVNNITVVTLSITPSLSTVIPCHLLLHPLPSPSYTHSPFNLLLLLTPHPLPSPSHHSFPSQPTVTPLPSPLTLSSLIPLSTYCYPSPLTPHPLPSPSHHSFPSQPTVTPLPSPLTQLVTTTSGLAEDHAKPCPVSCASESLRPLCREDVPNPLLPWLDRLLL